MALVHRHALSEAPEKVGGYECLRLGSQTEVITFEK